MQLQPVSARHQIEPLLRAFGCGVTWVGEGEVARLVKIAHNAYLGYSYSGFGKSRISGNFHDSTFEQGF
jgi:3-hydroxyisobutyrate dehydrogenase-like beta-hydroxyacid dehydrogenase